ncbi:MAG: hypothetical protein QW299_09030 [Candidatus Caldarchaeum sp.]|jgi:hypothetical protein
MPRKKKARQPTISDFFQERLKEVQARQGTPGVFLGQDAERVVIGIPLPAFSLQYLYSANVYPLGRMEMLIGESDSCKTAFLFEKGRWFLSTPGGGFVYLLNEARDPAALRSSIIGEDLLSDGRFVLEGPCESMEDWQRRISHKEYGWLRKLEAVHEEIGDCAFPFLLGLDSITGTTNEKTIASIDEAGHASISFAQDANLLNQYAKYLFQRLYPWPVSFVCTNHIKYGQDRYGNRVMRIPGGDELRYVSTYIVLLKHVKDIERTSVDGGRRIRFETVKTMGDRRIIEAEFLWLYNQHQVPQKSWWDWHSASTELLLSLSLSYPEKLQDILTFPTVYKNQRSCSCPELGLPKPAPYAEVGAALMDPQNEKVLQALQDRLGIRRYRLFEFGISYRGQQERALAEGSLESESPTREPSDGEPTSLPAD